MGKAQGDSGVDYSPISVQRTEPDSLYQYCTQHTRRNQTQTTAFLVQTVLQGCLRAFDFAWH
eukprot:1924929-Rhodomonas_salina.1